MADNDQHMYMHFDDNGDGTTNLTTNIIDGEEIIIVIPMDFKTFANGLMTPEAIEAGRKLADQSFVIPNSPDGV